MRHPRPRLLYPEGRVGSTAYVVEMYTTPKGVYVGRQYASHGSLLRWRVLAGVLRRAKKSGLWKGRI